MGDTHIQFISGFGVVMIVQLCLLALHYWAGVELPTLVLWFPCLLYLVGISLLVLFLLFVVVIMLIGIIGEALS